MHLGRGHRLPTQQYATSHAPTRSSINSFAENGRTAKSCRLTPPLVPDNFHQFYLFGDIQELELLVSIAAMAQLSVCQMFVLPKGGDHTKHTWCSGVQLRKEFPSAGSSVQRCVVKAVMTPMETSKSLGAITKGDFPILDQYINGNKLVYLDSAATSQKPVSVIKTLTDYYQGYNANVHRGVHDLSARSTEAYEFARRKIAAFINARSDREIAFTRNASEAINLVANAWGVTNLKAGDEIILSVAEHHSNLVPWQLLQQRIGVVLRFVGLTPEETLDLDQLKGLINERTKLVSIFHLSNVLGCVNPIADIVEWAHAVGGKVLVDGCQSVPHMPVDVQALGADFLVASSHKMCGPTGMGFLWGKSEILESMPPFLGGGEMIDEVYLDRSTYAMPPSRFEAGTPAIGEAIGLGAAMDYLSSIGMDRVHAYEMELSKYLYNSLSKIPNVRVYGPPPGADRCAALCSFSVKGVHASDMSTFLDQEHGVATRSGHHCAQPLHDYLGVCATLRASLYFYNTDEVDKLVEGLKDTISFFSVHQ